ncbi:MAG: DNA primase [Thermoplasmatales archaeon]|nr:DNA primase [Thermoplasmatales archaeon]MCW6171175.1 DNA primase [Thermoplasmatales archaeon]
MIKAKISTDGVVEKPDVVGAIFGQSEGLLGDELDLRDLQKGGKIGRIEVDIDSKKGRTEGVIFIPSGLDKVESSILAASLETIDRIGPCKARVEIESIEDVRVQRRQKIIERAEDLYKKMNDRSKTVSESLVASVREEVEKGDIISYGEEKLPAGPAINDSDSIIVVEGRSDILNLLKYGIKNTIAVQGTNIPKTVQKISRERTVTVFLDGDRGGDLILKEMLQVAEVDFVARAPPGTEVEELTYKQIVKALRYKTPIEQYLSMKGMSEELKELSERNAQETSQKPTKKAEDNQKGQQKPKETETSEDLQVTEANDTPTQETDNPNGSFSLSDPRAIARKGMALAKEKLTEIYDAQGTVLGTFQIPEAVDKMASIQNANTLITGGVISQRMIDVAYRIGIKNIYGARVGLITKKPIDVRIAPWDHR